MRSRSAGPVDVVRPGGEWAFEQSVSGTPLSLSAGEPEDAAVLTCEGFEYYECAIDILVGSNWVRYWIADELAVEERERVATEVANAIVANVRRS